MDERSQVNAKFILKYVVVPCAAAYLFFFLISWIT